MLPSTLPPAVVRHLQQRYRFNDFSEVAARVAHLVATPELKYSPLRADLVKERFEAQIASLRFLPAGNTLAAAAGKADVEGDHRVRPNCSVLGRVDDATFAATVHRAEALWSNAVGVGFDLSGCRDPVAALYALAERNDAIDLGHRPKRGNMAVLRADHPRVRAFMRCKNNNPEAVYNFNISVAATAADVERALCQDAKAPPHHGPDDAGNKGSWLLAAARAAWRTGDPGIAFIDAANAAVHPLASAALGPYETCVPCGEQFMHAEETCNLGSLNLPAFLAPGDGETPTLDHTALRASIYDAVRFLDNVVDLLDIPDARMAALAPQVRRVGLGVMGFADFLDRLGVAYASPEALAWADRLGALLQTEAQSASRALARERGGFRLPGVRMPFSARNLTVTCIAPTGGINLLTGNKGFSIEPRMDEALGIPPEAHVRMQARWQHYIDNAISKTVSLRHDSTPQDVYRVMKLAYYFGCKGVTVFRDGCRGGTSPHSLGGDASEQKAPPPSRCATCEDAER